MAWTAEVSRESPVVRASLTPQTVPETEVASLSEKPTTPVRSGESQSVSQAPGSLQQAGRSRGYRKLGKRYQVAGVWYTPRHDENYEETGMASWYGDRFHAKRTANGEIYDMHALTAAHRTLPLPSLVRVTNLENGRSVVVRVNDRGPFKKGRIIDVSARAAHELQFAQKGVAKVHVKYLGPAPLDSDGERAPAAQVARALKAATSSP